ncbi:hypothetical protein Sste5346_003898 [Sporothrix stenoceras]|uniref:Uncharacterized protein n=1 Tax=Sporothrix stenoceras TaxID=5173 RepID=A0ABR3ZBC8_9PEZI
MDIDVDINSRDCDDPGGNVDDITVTTPMVTTPMVGDLDLTTTVRDDVSSPFVFHRSVASPPKASPSSASKKAVVSNKTLRGRILKKANAKAKIMDGNQFKKMLAGHPGPSTMESTTASATNGIEQRQEMANAHAEQIASGDTDIARLKYQINDLSKMMYDLRHENWALENRVTALKATVLTNEEQLLHTSKMEAKLDHALRYIEALKKQVRSYGGTVFADGMEGFADSVAQDGDDNSEDGDIPAYYPQAAAKPQQYTALAIQNRRALK